MILMLELSTLSKGRLLHGNNFANKQKVHWGKWKKHTVPEDAVKGNIVSLHLFSYRSSRK